MKKFISVLLSAALFGSLMIIPTGAAEKKEAAEIVIAFGDSITAANQWQPDIEAKYGISITNAGIGGNSTDNARARFKADVLNKKPTCVFISFGTNDAALDDANKHVTPEKYEENLIYFITELQKIDCEVILAVPPHVELEKFYTRHEIKAFDDVGGYETYLEKYREVVRRLADEYQTGLADLAKATEDEDLSVILSDGVHPTAVGYKILSRVYGEQYFVVRLLGDLDDDGAITALDYFMLKRAHFGVLELEKDIAVRADINRNGKVEAADYFLLKQHCFGIKNIKVDR